VSTPEPSEPFFTITDQAAAQIRGSAQQDTLPPSALRIAATLKPDGGIDYRMGFDEPGADDLSFQTARITVLIAPTDKALLQGATLDYVEIEPGNHRYIFLNPNDTHYRPPVEE
jgi:iron-sulfur cluster assembly protein